MTIRTDDLGRITQQTAVLTADGDRLGTINQIYTSDSTGEPAWVTVTTGLFGSQESFVPLADASFDGDDIRVPVTKDQVHGAPRVDADGHLSVEEEDGLDDYYRAHDTGGVDDRVGPTETRDDVDERRDDDRDHDLDDGRDDELTERDDELAARDAEGRDEVADSPDATPRRAVAEDAPGAADASGSANEGEGVRPGERTTRLRRYVVTERVVQTIEELPDERS